MGLLEIYHSLQKRKNFANRSRIDKVIAMVRVAWFFYSQCIIIVISYRQKQLGRVMERLPTTESNRRANERPCEGTDITMQDRYTKAASEEACQIVTSLLITLHITKLEQRWTYNFNIRS